MIESAVPVGINREVSVGIKWGSRIEPQKGRATRTVLVHLRELRRGPGTPGREKG